MDVSTLRTVKKKINLWSYLNICIHVPLHFFLNSACAIGDSFSVSIQSGSSSSSWHYSFHLLTQVKWIIPLFYCYLLRSAMAIATFMLWIFLASYFVSYSLMIWIHSNIARFSLSVCPSLFSLLNIKVLLFSHEILTRHFYKQFYGQQTASPPSTRHNSSRKKWAIPINNSPIHSSLTLSAPVAPPRTSAGLRPC